MPELLSTDLTSSKHDLCEKARQVLELRDDVFALWETQVRDKVAGAQDVAGPILLDTLPLLYGNIVEALCPGSARDNATTNTTAAAGHGGERARSTEYRVVEVVHEYQLLREALLCISAQHGIVFTSDELLTITRSFDCAIRESVAEFSLTQSAFREQIAATLTHDMRTPLSVILSAAQLLPDQDAAGREKLTKKITDNGRRLETMFSEQLDAFNRALPGLTRLNVSNWNALELARQVCEQLTNGFDKPCEVVGDPVSGWWDRGLLQRAVENLVGNALKYGASDSAVIINVTEAFGRLIISVHNVGNPIAEDQQAQIFRYLNRLDNSDKKGWGIGLPFVQDVATRHGGTVIIDSSQAAGTTFAIDIPCDARVFPNGQ